MYLYKIDLVSYLQNLILIAFQVFKTFKTLGKIVLKSKNYLTKILFLVLPFRIPNVEYQFNFNRYPFSQLNVYGYVQFELFITWMPNAYINNIASQLINSKLFKKFSNFC